MVNTVDYPSEIAMPVLPAPTEPTHELEGTRFTSLATPSRGSADTALWRVEDGTARVTFPDGPQFANPGDVIVVPSGVDVTLANDGRSGLRMLCCMPVGGQVAVAERVFTPPWAE
jgi:mannose-6-phosphate isomerase-like protein (cupin superfamily)